MDLFSVLTLQWIIKQAKLKANHLFTFLSKEENKNCFQFMDCSLLNKLKLVILKERKCDTHLPDLALDEN